MKDPGRVPAELVVKFTVATKQLARNIPLIRASVPYAHAAQGGRREPG
jgi:hypothetical protein